MNLNVALFDYDLISKIRFADENERMSKETSLKVMGNRLMLSKLQKDFDSECKEFITQRKPDWFDELAQKENKTDEEIKKLKDEESAINAEYNEYVKNKVQEEIDIKLDFFTEDEYSEIFQVNLSNDVELKNGAKFTASDLLEIIHDQFVK
jgi:hypothetical protein